jgi:hypothetical protein
MLQALQSEVEKIRYYSRKKLLNESFGYLSNSIEQSPWEANSRSASQEIPLLLYNPKFHCRVHKTPPLVTIHYPEPDESSPKPPTLFPLRFILILSSHIHVVLPRGLLLSGFTTKTLCAFLIFFHACYVPRPSHPPLLDRPNKIWWSVQVMKLLIM